MSTWRQLVEQVAWSRYFHGPFSDAECDAILWEETAFPMAGELGVRRHLERYFDFLTVREPSGEHGGRSTCPVCGRRWWVRPLDDCLLPSCGCFGTDTTAANPERPCQDCGIRHYYRCDAERANTAAGIRSPE